MYIYDNISQNSSSNEKCFSQSCRENQNTLFMFNNHFFENRAVYEIMWKTLGEPEKPQMTKRRMRFACWIPSPPPPTHTSFSLRKCNTYCFSKATTVTRTRLNVPLYAGPTLPVLLFLYQNIPSHMCKCTSVHTPRAILTYWL